MTDALMLVAGLVTLLGGAWLMVREASRLALRLGLPPGLVGATVVAFGTSAPEFIVSTVASAQGSGDLAVGNVLGSNVANMGLVLGLAIVIGPLFVGARLLRWEIPVLGVATALLLLFGASGEIGRIEGAALLGLLFVFVAGSLRIGAESARARQAVVGPAAPSEPGAPWREVGLLLVGIVGLAVGAELLVRGATGLADTLELSEVVVGAVIVAMGTSLPEIATTSLAALRREHALAVGNAVGSNIFNLLGVLGLAALVSPLEIERDLYDLELPALVLSSAILLPLARRGIARGPQGLMLLLLYAAFIAAVLGRG